MPASVTLTLPLNLYALVRENTHILKDMRVSRTMFLGILEGRTPLMALTSGVTVYPVLKIDNELLANTAIKAGYLRSMVGEEDMVIPAPLRSLPSFMVEAYQPRMGDWIIVTSTEGEVRIIEPHIFEKVYGANLRPYPG